MLVTFGYTASNKDLFADASWPDTRSQALVGQPCLTDNIHYQFQHEFVLSVAAQYITIRERARLLGENVHAVVVNHLRPLKK